MEYLKKKWFPYDDWSQRVAFRCDFCNHIEGVNGIYLYWETPEDILGSKIENPSYLICKSCEEKYDNENSD